jgi:hypothetical protein
MEDPSFMADFTIKLQPYHTTPDTFVYQKGADWVARYLVHAHNGLQPMDCI